MPKYVTETSGSRGYGDKAAWEHFSITTAQSCLNGTGNGYRTLREDGIVVRTMCHFGEIRRNNKTGYGYYGDDPDYQADSRERARYFLNMGIEEAKLLESTEAEELLIKVKEILKVKDWF